MNRPFGKCWWRSEENPSLQMLLQYEELKKKKKESNEIYNTCLSDGLDHLYHNDSSVDIHHHLLLIFFLSTIVSSFWDAVIWSTTVSTVLTRVIASSASFVMLCHYRLGFLVCFLRHYLQGRRVSFKFQHVQFSSCFFIHELCYRADFNLNKTFFQIKYMNIQILSEINIAWQCVS